MSPTKLPQRKKPYFRFRRPLFRNALSAATAISFSLTFVGVIIALLAGFLPRNFALLEIDAQVDTGVMLLFVPLCALVLAILAEVLRAAMRGPVRPQVPRLRRPLSNWQSGPGKG